MAQCRSGCGASDTNFLVSMNDYRRDVSDFYPVRRRPSKLSITCLLGNGFDMGLGLKTSYRDFLEEFTSNEVNATASKKWLIQKIRHSGANWSDAEAAFGKLDFSSKGKDVEGFYLDCIRDFQSELKSYLLTEQCRLDIPREQQGTIAQAFFGKLINALRFDVDSAIKAKVQDRIDAADLIEFNFVNFNYTQTLEMVIGWKSGSKPIDVGYLKDTGARLVLSEVCHPHGKLDGEMVFGVSDVSQVVDPEMASLASEDGYLIKDKMLGGNERDYNRAKELMLRSDIIFLFGLSYGATDKNWWDCIATELFVRDALSAKMPRKFCILAPFTLGRHISQTPSDRIHNLKYEVGKLTNGMSAAARALFRKNNNIAILGYGPYRDPVNSKSYFCDPLRLKSIGRQYVDGYIEIDDLCKVKSEDPRVQAAIDAHNTGARQRGIGVFA